MNTFQPFSINSLSSGLVDFFKTPTFWFHFWFHVGPKEKQLNQGAGIGIAKSIQWFQSWFQVRRKIAPFLQFSYEFVKCCWGFAQMKD